MVPFLMACIFASFQSSSSIRMLVTVCFDKFFHQSVYLLQIVVFNALCGVVVRTAYDSNTTCGNALILRVADTTRCGAHGERTGIEG